MIRNASVQIGRDAHQNTIITGDNNVVHVFVTQVSPGITSTTDHRNPYRSLAAFDESDANSFHGREELIKRLWKRFSTLFEPGATDVFAVRFMAILGPSGSGKSSVARAGLLAEIARQSLPGKRGARVVVFTPEAHPLQSLAGALARVVATAPLPAKLAREYADELTRTNRQGEYDGLRRIAALIPTIATSPLVLLIDQFEEIFTRCDDADERTGFLENLIYAAKDTSQHVAVILTMRSDFIRETQFYPLLNRVIAEHEITVPVMDDDQLRRAISEPAIRSGYPLQETVVQTLIRQTQGRDGALPLLQFALTRVWDGMQKGIEPTVTLRQVGGVGGALAHVAQEMYDALDEDAKLRARRVFLGLVNVSNDQANTRRRAAIADPRISKGEDIDRVREVLRHFSRADARIITLSADLQGNETAEITHEALLEHWELFQQWIEPVRQDLLVHRRLEEAAKHWESEKNSLGVLWRSPDLDILQGFYGRNHELMSEVEVAFYDGSVALAKKQKKLRRFAITTVIASAATFAALALFAGFQWRRVEIQRASTEIQRRIAVSRQLAAQSNDLLESKTDLGLLLSVESNEIYDTVESRAALMRGLQTTADLITMVPTSKPEQGVIAFSPDKSIFAATVPRGIQLWDAQTFLPLGDPIKVPDVERIGILAFSPDAVKLASFDDQNHIQIWNTRTHSSTGRINIPFEIRALAFDSDGSKLVVSRDDGGEGMPSISETTSRFPLHEGATANITVQTILIHGLPNRGVQALSSNGLFLAYPDGSREAVYVWNLKTKKKIEITSNLQVKPDEDPIDIHSIAVTPDGQSVASGDSDGAIKIWKTKTRSLARPDIDSGQLFVFDLTFSPDGKQLASVGESGGLRVWHTSTPKIPTFIRMLHHLPREVHDPDELIFTPDETAFLQNIDDSTFQIFNTEKIERLCIPIKSKKKGKVRSFLLLDEFMALVTRPPGVIELWDLQNDSLVRRTEFPKTRIRKIAVSPNKKIVAVACSDGLIHFLNASSLEESGTALKANVFDFAFCQGNDNLTVIDRAGYISQLNIETSKKLNLFTDVNVKNLVADDALALGYIPISPDGTKLAICENTAPIAGGQTGYLQIWDVVSAKPIGPRIVAHRDFFCSAFFSPDSKKLATASFRDNIRLWDVDTFVPMGEPIPADDMKWGFFSKDSERLGFVEFQSHSKSAPTEILDLNISHCRKKALQIAGRNLTDQERKQYIGDLQISD